MYRGKVILLTVVPLLPGMSYYYYRIMVQLHDEFASQGVVFVILPIDQGEGLHIKETSQEEIVVLEEESPSSLLLHPWIQKSMAIVPRKGAVAKTSDGQFQQLELQTDRVNAFVVSADGYFVERWTMPQYKVLQWCWRHSRVICQK